MKKQLTELAPHTVVTPQNTTINTNCFGYFCNYDDNEVEFAQLIDIAKNRFIVRDNAGHKLYYDLYIQFI